jgi:hypothetical protein
MSGIQSMSYSLVREAMRAEDARELVPRVCANGLTDIVDGRPDLASIRHPLGFLCLPMWREGEYGVCVHVWSSLLRSVHTTTSPIHSHSWDLTSFVLYGQVDNRVIQVDDDVAGSHRMFEIQSTGGLDEIRATPRLVRWVERDREVAGPGDIYHLPAGRFHESIVDIDQGAATVVLGQTRAAPDRSLGRIEDTTHRVPRQRCRQEETVHAAHIILGRLAADAVAGGKADQ